jgi:RNA polymerase sigma-70 factor (ECF subfamily)
MTTYAREKKESVVSDSSVLQSAFVEVLSAERMPLVEACPDVGQALVLACEQAQMRWPSFAVTPRDFVRYMANILNEHPPKSDLDDWFAHLQAGDLWLVYACCSGLEDAIAAFEATHASLLKRVIKRYQHDLSTGEDLYQIVNERLFVGTSRSGPKLRAYAGQGFLENWLRVTCTRICLDIVRVGVQQKRENAVPEDMLNALPDEGLDVELAFLKKEYRGHFKKAFAEALQSLSSAERNMLRQHLVARLSLDQMAAVHHVHRATIARRLAKARQSLLQGTRESLMLHLRISENEFDSIMNLIQSRLDVSVQRLLGQNSAEFQRKKESP